MWSPHQLKEDDSKKELVHELCMRPLQGYLKKYASSVKNNDLLCHLTHMEVPQLVKYESKSNEHFIEHADNWNVKSTGRQLSVVVYLNDVEKGGELVFNNGTIVQPKQGRMVMFPSFFTHRHQAKPPESGNKYALVTWFGFNEGSFPNDPVYLYESFPLLEVDT